MLIIIVGAIGLVWLVATLLLWIYDVINHTKNTGPISGVKRIITSNWGHDFLLSCVFVALGLMMMGVTGLTIGLVASVMASVALWIFHIVRKTI